MYTFSIYFPIILIISNKLCLVKMIIIDKQVDYVIR